MNDDKPVYIFDSFALLAYLGGENGAQQVLEIISSASRKESQALLSLINLGELVSIVERERGLARAQQVLAIIEQLPIKILPVERQTVLAAAHIKAKCPLAYADAFTVAAAQEFAGVIVTGDPEFRAVSHIAYIEWVGEVSNSS